MKLPCGTYELDNNDGLHLHSCRASSGPVEVFQLVLRATSTEPFHVFVVPGKCHDRISKVE